MVFLQLGFYWLALVQGEGLFTMLGGAIYIIPISLLLALATILACKSKRWFLAAATILLSLPGLLLLPVAVRLFFFG
ncbi:hypothetical protein BXP70_11815 [Hymenobacter crusticola]|uniref:Uncharacterized protein n=1 Tax=Hymenobacter crusticola TaxID=1770526 RepID=A0A243WDX8_9BACT|nr:hypothetical protein BXP70_11815 [Hymenobacter crusticola]